MTEEKKLEEGVVRCARRVCHWLYNRRPDVLDSIFSELWGEEIITPDDVTEDAMLKGESVDYDEILGTKLELIIASVKGEKKEKTLEIISKHTANLPGLKARAKKLMADREKKFFQDIAAEEPIIAASTAIYACLNNQRDPWIDEYIKTAAPMTEQEAQDDMARNVNLGDCFDDCSAVKKYTEVLKKKMAAAAETSADHLPMAMTGSMEESPGFVINSFISRCLNEFNADPYIPSDYSIRKRCLEIYSDAADSVCRQFIYDVIYDVLVDSTDAVIDFNEKENVSIITEERSRTRIKVMAALKRRCNSADGKELLIHAMWDASIRTNMHYLAPMLKKRFLDAMSNDKKAIETKESRLKRNFSRVEKQYRHQIAQLKMENSILQKNNNLSRGEKEIPAESDSHRSFSKKARAKEEKTLKKLYKELDEKDEMISALQEKIEDMKHASSEKKKGEIPEGKFMFVVTEEHLKMRLKS